MCIYAQDSLCVFNVNGNAFVKTDRKIMPLKKGALLNKNVEILVKSPSEITLINANGEAYKIERVGDYKFNDIINKGRIKDQKSLTSKYFKLVWDEFLQKESGKTAIGGVFRGDVLMEFPQDSTKLAGSKLNFKWKNSEENKTYYLFIKNLKTEDILKLSTNGNEISLYKTQAIFSEGDVFEWTVSTLEFPNLKNMPFSTFQLMSREEYAAFLESQSVLIENLKALRLTDEEVLNSLCETYDICK